MSNLGAPCEKIELGSPHNIPTILLYPTPTHVLTHRDFTVIFKSSYLFGCETYKDQH